MTMAIAVACAQNKYLTVLVLLNIWEELQKLKHTVILDDFSKKFMDNTLALIRSTAKYEVSAFGCHYDQPLNLMPAIEQVLDPKNIFNPELISLVCEKFCVNKINGTSLYTIEAPSIVEKILHNLSLYETNVREVPWFNEFVESYNK